MKRFRLLPPEDLHPNIQIEVDSASELLVLARRLHYRVYSDSGLVLAEGYIPKGFHCDGGSIPKTFTGLLRVSRTDPRAIAAFLVHDYLYGGGAKRLGLTRSESDEAMTHYQGALNIVQRGLIRTFVFGFGWIFFTK